MNDNKKCGNCMYFKLLTKHKESWGVCEWFNHNTVSPMPVWVNKKDMSRYGSISPEQRKCDVYDEGE